MYLKFVCSHPLVYLNKNLLRLWGYFGVDFPSKGQIPKHGGVIEQLRSLLNFEGILI